MSSISAGTTSTTGLVATSDTTGTLLLQTGATPTTALTIDASQNVSGVGSIGTTIASKTAQFNAAGGSIYAQFADGTTTWRLGTGIQAAGQFNLYDVTNAQTALTFAPGASGYTAFLQNNSEQMRLTSTGLGIGTSSPASKLDVTSAYVDPNATAHGTVEFNSNTSFAINKGGSISLGGAYTGTSTTQFGSIIGAKENGTDGNYAGYLAFQTRPNGSTSSERARITSAGDFLVGKTAVGITAGGEMQANGLVTSTRSGSTNATSSFQLYSTGAGLYRFYVGMDGTINATSTTITGISDQRLKENIRDLDDGLDIVMALKPRKFDWKTGKGKNIKNDRGFIAQEFETVLPDMIEKWKDPAPEGEEPYKAVNVNLIPTLVKAIQEQQAIIESLTTRLTALE